MDQPMTEDAPEKPTPGHYFQTLDRAHVASLYLQTVFDGDLVLEHHPELHTLLEQAVESLEQLYQAVGQHDLGLGLPPPDALLQG